MLWGKPYKNRKNGKIYEVIGNAIDRTNATEGREMILYIDDNGGWHAREAKEFYEKFEDIT